MGGLTLFGKSYETLGSSNTNLILKTQGDIKIQWGGKYIDLIKNGKINTGKDSNIEIVDDIESVRKDGIYVVKNDEQEEVWLCIKGTKIKINSGDTTNVSFTDELKATAELKHRALTNIGFYYPTLQDALLDGVKSGLIFIEDVSKLYIATPQGLLEVMLKSAVVEP